MSPSAFPASTTVVYATPQPWTAAPGSSPRSYSPTLPPPSPTSPAARLSHPPAEQPTMAPSSAPSYAHTTAPPATTNRPTTATAAPPSHSPAPLPPPAPTTAAPDSAAHSEPPQLPSPSPSVEPAITATYIPTLALAQALTLTPTFSADTLQVLHATQVCFALAEYCVAVNGTGGDVCCRPFWG